MLRYKLNHESKWNEIMCNLYWSIINKLCNHINHNNHDDYDKYIVDNEDKNNDDDKCYITQRLSLQQNKRYGALQQGKENATIGTTNARHVRPSSDTLDGMSFGQFITGLIQHLITALIFPLGGRANLNESELHS